MVIIKIFSLIMLSFLQIYCEKQVDPSILAIVGSTQVTAYSFYNSYSNILINSQIQDSEYERNKHLNKMIRTKLFSEEARKEKLILGPEEKSMILMEKEKALREELYNHIIGSEVEPIPDSVSRLHYKWQHTEIHIKHLFHKNKERIDSLKIRLNSDPGLFNSIARSLFENYKLKNSGGDLGWISYNTLDPALEKLAYEIPVGEISDPVQSSYGWHILLKINERVQLIISEDEYQIQKPAIIRSVSTKQKKVLADSYVNNLMTNDISIHDSLVNQTLRDIHWIISQKRENLSELYPIIDGEKIKSVLKDLKLNQDLILARFPDGNFTIYDLLDALRQSKPVVFSRNPLQSFYIALRDKILTVEAKKLKLENNLAVQLKTQDAKDNYLAREYLLSIKGQTETAYISSKELTKITKRLQSKIPIKIYDKHLKKLFDYSLR